MSTTNTVNTTTNTNSTPLMMNPQSFSTIPRGFFEEMNSMDDLTGHSSLHDNKANIMMSSPPPPPPEMPALLMRSGVGPFPQNISIPQPNQQTANLMIPPPSSVNLQNTPVNSNSATISNGVKPLPASWGRLKLVGEACKDAPAEFLLSDTKIVIGRGLQSHVKIISNTLSKFVSRNHADIIKVNDSTFLISDLGSTNGTLLNGKKIGKDAELKHGDLIIITGGVKALIGEYINLEDGKMRSDFSSEQEWKCALINSMKNAFMYKFEMMQAQFIGQNLNPARSAINVKAEEEFKVPNPPKTVKSQTVTGKRGRTEEVSSTEFESDSKKVKEDDGKWSKFVCDCSEEFNCTICCGLMVEPTVLECGHSFCRRCLHDWLAKNKSCPLCRKKLTHSSAPNRTVETILKNFVYKCAKEEDVKDYDDRIKAISVKDDEDFAKLTTLIENAKIKKIKFLDITVRWKLEEKRTFKNGVKQYFGKCRDEFCKIVGLTENFVNNCNNEQLIIACENLDLPVAYMIVGQEIKTMRRVVDFNQTRQNFINFWNAKDNLV